MSPRAACRLERLGFSEVYDYVAGKMDRLSFALPHEGQALLAGDVARREVPTCGPEETAGALRARLEQAGTGFCVVTSPGGVVLGVLQGGLDQAAADATVEEVMDFGITTVRPAEEVGPLVERMPKAGVEAILLTRSDGILYGLLARAEAEAILGRAVRRTPRISPRQAPLAAIGGRPPTRSASTPRATLPPPTA
ncbi:MAG: CBS domain-containing protein [Acidimicrobiales bacterium]